MSKEIYNQLVSDPAFRRDYLLNIKSASRGLVGTLSNYIPEEIIAAAGFHPVRLFGRFASSDAAVSPLPTPVCSFARDCYAAAAAGEFALLDEVIFPNSCDSIRVLVQAWQSREGLPPAWCLLHPLNTDESAVVYFADQLRVFADHLTALAGRPFSSADLLAAVEKYNQTRRLLRRLDALRRANPASIKGSDALALQTAGLVMDREEYNRRLEAAVAECQSAPVSESKAKRILITGPLMDSIPLVEAVEQFGGVVIAEDTTNGLRYADLDVETGGDLYENLARRYLLASPSPTRHSPPGRNAAAFEKLAADLRPGGVICISQEFCEPHLHGFIEKKTAAARLGLPILLLEIEHGKAAVGHRDLLRIETFLETVK